MLKPCLGSGEVLGNDGAVYVSLKKWIRLSKFLRVSPDGANAQYYNDYRQKWVDLASPAVDYFEDLLNIYRKGYAEGSREP